MKKIFSFVLFCLFTVSSFSQQVYIDKMLNENIRYVETSNICYRKFTDTHIWNYGLSCYANDTIKSFVLCININSSSKINIKENGILLIKTFTNDVIELKTSSSDFDKITLGYQYNKPLVGNIGTISENIIAKNIAYFSISEDNLILLKNGISKVRLETTSDYVEYEYKKDKIGSPLFNSFNIINETLKHEIKNTIKDNF